MKFTKLNLILIFYVFSFGQESNQEPEKREIVTERHANGLKKLVLVFEGSGLNEVLIGKYGFYENGLKSFVELYKNNQLHGEFISWNERGIEIIRGSHKNGLMDGIWIYNYKGGTRLAKGSFVNGNKEKLDYYYQYDVNYLLYKENQSIPINGRDGLWEFWDEEGNNISKISYVNGKRNGDAIFWYKNGKKEINGMYQDGMMNGLWTFYYKNGKEKARGSYINGNGEDLVNDWDVPLNGKDGIWEFWMENGKEKYFRSFKNNRLNGKYINWYMNGKKELETFYKNDSLNGSYTKWYDNGKKLEETFYKNDNLNGSYTKWHEDGKKSEETFYKNDSINGPATKWHKNGKKLIEAFFNNGYLQNSYNEWDENGDLIINGNYIDGEKSGLWKYWFKGKLEKEITYKSSIENKKTKYLYWENNNIMSIKNFRFYESEWELDGYFIENFESGNKSTEGYYLKNKKDSTWTSYNKEGEKISDLYYENGSRVKYTMYEYWDNGSLKKLKNYRKIKLNGPYISLYENGFTQAEGKYNDGKKNFKWLYYWPDGNIHQKVTYQNGLYNGEKSTWYQNGEVDEVINYKTNVKEGNYEKYYENGKIMIQGGFMRGLKHGSWIEWDNYGNLIYEDIYDLGISRNEKNNLAKINIITKANEYIIDEGKWLEDEYWTEENFFNEKLSLEDLRDEYRKMISQRDQQIAFEYTKFNKRAMFFMRMALLGAAGGYGMSVEADNTYNEYKKAQFTPKAKELYDQATMQDNISNGIYLVSAGMFALSIYYESQRVLLKKIIKKNNNTKIISGANYIDNIQKRKFK